MITLFSLATLGFCAVGLLFSTPLLCRLETSPCSSTPDSNEWSPADAWKGPIHLNQGCWSILNMLCSGTEASGWWDTLLQASQLLQDSYCYRKVAILKFDLVPLSLQWTEKSKTLHHNNPPLSHRAVYCPSRKKHHQNDWLIPHSLKIHPFTDQETKVWSVILRKKYRVKLTIHST